MSKAGSVEGPSHLVAFLGNLKKKEMREDEAKSSDNHSTLQKEQVKKSFQFVEQALGNFVIFSSFCHMAQPHIIKYRVG